MSGNPWHTRGDVVACRTQWVVMNSSSVIGEDGMSGTFGELDFRVESAIIGI